MRQRAALLRTFLAGRDVLLLDEPFGSLDALTREAMREWLLGVWEADRKTILLVTHDVEEAVFLSDRVYVMSGRPGRVRADVEIALARPRALELTGRRAVRGASRAAARAASRAGARGSWERRERAAAAGARAGRAPRAAPARGAARRRGRGARAAAARCFGVVLVGAWELYVAISGVRAVDRPGPGRSRARCPRPQRAPSSGGTTLVGDPLGYAIAASSASRSPSRSRARAWSSARSTPGSSLADGADPGDRPGPGPLDRLRHPPALIVIALVTFFPIAVNTIDGLRATDPELVGLLRTLGARPLGSLPRRAAAVARCPTCSAGCASPRRSR